MGHFDRNKAVCKHAELYEKHFKVHVVLYEHMKTGNIYFTLDHDVINATNERDGQKMILYSDGANIYVREKAEFYDKFIKLEKLAGENNEHN